MSEMEKKEPYCPFYLQDTRCSITCEGMMTNECMMHRFKNSQEKENWMDAACRSPKCARSKPSRRMMPCTPFPRLCPIRSISCTEVRNEPLFETLV